jgi:hypothetical protein
MLYVGRELLAPIRVVPGLPGLGMQRPGQK